RDHLVGMCRDIERPFELRHIRKVLQGPTGLKAGEKCWERASVLEEAGPRRRVGADILIGRIAEEPLVNETAHHGEGRLEGRRERGEHMMAIDVDPRLGCQTIAQDVRHRRLDGAAEEGFAERGLHLTQRWHTASLIAHDTTDRRRRRLQRAACPASGYRCPTRRGWPPGRNATGHERRAATPPARRM